MHNINYIKSIALLLLGEFFIALMMCAIKQLSDIGYSGTTLVFYRNLIGVLLLLTLLYLTEKVSPKKPSSEKSPSKIRPQKKSFRQHLKTHYFRFHLLRAISGVSAMYCFFYVIANMPLAEASLIKLSMPFFLPIIAFFWLGEPIKQMNILAMLIGFFGVIIILQPGSQQFQIMSLIGLGGAILSAVSKVTIRRMGSTEPSSRIVFYFGTLATLVSAIPMLLNPELPTLEATPWLLVIGLLGTLGQLFITYAYRKIDSGKIGLYTYASLLYASILGWVFWGELLTVVTLFGGLIIVIAGWINLKKG